MVCCVVVLSYEVFLASPMELPQSTESLHHVKVRSRRMPEKVHPEGFRVEAMKTQFRCLPTGLWNLLVDSLGVQSLTMPRLADHQKNRTILIMIPHALGESG